MKVEDVLSQVDELKPNAYEDEMKISWLNALEKKIFNSVVSNYEQTEDENYEYTPLTEQNTGEELIAPDEYAGVYVFYLMGKIDFFNQDTDLYMNDAAMFNQAFQELADYWSRTHEAKGSDSFYV